MIRTGMAIYNEIKDLLDKRQEISQAYNEVDDMGLESAASILQKELDAVDAKLREVQHTQYEVRAVPR